MPKLSKKLCGHYQVIYILHGDRFSKSRWKICSILSNFSHWYIEDKFFQLAHSISCLGDCLLQLCSQLFHDSVGFMTKLSSPEFIRNKSLIELGQLLMREQLEVAEILFLRSQFCLFSRNVGAFPARLLTMGAAAARPVCCSDFSVDSPLFPFSLCIWLASCSWTWWLFLLFLWKLLHQLNWYCFYGVIFFMSVAVSLSLLCRVDGLAAAVQLAFPHHFVSLPYKYWSVVSSSLPVFCPIGP